MASTETLGSRLRKAWNIFTSKESSEPVSFTHQELGYGYSRRQDKFRLSKGSERTIVTSIFNRIAMDVSAVDIKHVRLDEDGRFISVIDSGLNTCLNLEANIDQTGRTFIQDAVISMMDEGCVAIVPIETSVNPNDTSSYDILNLRVGKIVEWFPQHVKVNIYNERTGKREDIIVSKSTTAIIENPLYSVINEPNSTLQRLIRKLSLLDFVDEQSSSGKLDLIIQLPYVVKSDARQQQAESRRKQIEEQLTNTKFGIAYTDGTEKIVQLNRPIENNLMKQIEFLTTQLYSQLGITQTVLDGTADEKTLLNYYNRITEPILSAITNEMRRKFLTKTARTQGQSIKFFRDPFRLVPVNQLAEIADKFTRNCIATSNELRQAIGWKPSDDPQADMLVNNNLNQPAMGSEDMGPDDMGEENPEMERTYPTMEELVQMPISQLTSISEEDSNV